MNSASAIELLREKAATAFSRGDLSTAESACASIVSANPYDSPAHLILANIASAQGRHRLATDHALLAAARMGRQPVRHIAAVSLKLISVGEYAPAANLIRKIDPAIVKSPPFLVEFSQQLSLMEQHEQAFRFMEAAISYGVAGESVRFIRGNYLKFLGRLEEAAADYERCLAEYPGYAYAHWALAYLGLPGDNAGRANRIRRVLAQNPTNQHDVAYLNYALFKELDALGDTAEAWQALEQGAKARRSLVKYDANRESLIFDQTMRECADWRLPPASSSAAPRTPIFILGLPRTGTTLLERVLGGNGDVALCGELNDFRMQYKWETDYYCTGFLDEVAAARLNQTDYERLGKRYLEHVAWRAPTARYFTDKNPSNFSMVGPILRALPHARILHLRRNAMDSCFSNLKELFGGDAHPYSYSFEDLAGHYRNYSRLMSYWHSIAPDRILDVHYESLVSEPEATARSVMAFCGLAFDPVQVDIQANSAPVSTASSAQVRQPIHRRNVGGWRRYAQQLEPLQALLGDAS